MCLLPDIDRDREAKPGSLPRAAQYQYIFLYEHSQDFNKIFYVFFFMRINVKSNFDHFRKFFTDRTEAHYKNLYIILWNEFISFI